MSQFDTDFAAGAAVDLFAYFGQAITYEGTAGTGVFRRLAEHELDTDRGRQADEMGELKIRTSEFGSPALEHTVVIGSDTWSVESIDEIVGGVATLTIRMITAIERTARNHRSRI